MFVSMMFTFIKAVLARAMKFTIRVRQLHGAGATVFQNRRVLAAFRASNQLCGGAAGIAILFAKYMFICGKSFRQTNYV